jgi:hypothetical protein
MVRRRRLKPLVIELALPLPGCGAFSFFYLRPQPLPGCPYTAPVCISVRCALALRSPMMSMRFPRTSAGFSFHRTSCVFTPGLFGSGFVPDAPLAVRSLTMLAFPCLFWGFSFLALKSGPGLYRPSLLRRAAPRLCLRVLVLPNPARPSSVFGPAAWFPSFLLSGCGALATSPRAFVLLCACPFPFGLPSLTMPV